MSPDLTWYLSGMLIGVLVGFQTGWYVRLWVQRRKDAKEKTR